MKKIICLCNGLVPSGKKLLPEDIEVYVAILRLLATVCQVRDIPFVSGSFVVRGQILSVELTAK